LRQGLICHILNLVEADAALRAIAHPARRAMLRLVWDVERQASELADAAALTRPAASQHLKLLREAGLVRVRVDANRRLYRVDVDRMAQLAAFLDAFWAAPLQRLRAVAESSAGARSRGAR
jgi:DNA-binding transcriptional ArsR family regulator